MKRAVRLLAVCLLFLVGACATLKETTSSEIFEKSLKDYNRMVRWDEAENAAQRYVDPELRTAFLARVAAAREIKVADYRIRSVDCDLARGEATARVEFDYYRLPGIQVKTVVDLQKWRFVEGSGAGRWNLETLYPQFE